MTLAFFFTFFYILQVCDARWGAPKYIQLYEENSSSKHSVTLPLPPNNTRQSSWIISGNIGKLLQTKLKDSWSSHDRPEKAWSHGNLTIASLNRYGQGMEETVLCNENGPVKESMYISSTHRVEIHYQTSAMFPIGHHGVTVEMIGCDIFGEDIREVPVVVSYPRDNTEYYLPNRTCTWRVTGSGYAEVLTMENWHFDLQKGLDHEDSLFVFDGNSEDAKLLGIYHNLNNPPFLIQASGSQLYLKMVTDSEVEGTGFKFSFYMATPIRPTSNPGLPRTARIGIGVGATVLFCCIFGVIGTIFSKFKAQRLLRQQRAAGNSMGNTNVVSPNFAPSFTQSEDSPSTVVPVMAPPPYESKPPPSYEEAIGAAPSYTQAASNPADTRIDTSNIYDTSNARVITTERGVFYNHNPGLATSQLSGPHS